MNATDFKSGKYLVWLLGLATLVLTWFHSSRYGPDTAFWFTITAAATLWVTFRVFSRRRTDQPDRETERILLLPFTVGVFIAIAMPEKFSHRYRQILNDRWSEYHPEVIRQRELIRLKTKLVTDPRFQHVTVRFPGDGPPHVVNAKFSHVDHFHLLDNLLSDAGCHVDAWKVTNTEADDFIHVVPDKDYDLRVSRDLDRRLSSHRNQHQD